MALIRCKACHGLGDMMGSGYMTVKCAVCEGSGRVSDSYTVTFDDPKEPIEIRVRPKRTRAPNKAKIVPDKVTLAQALGMEIM